ncbi:MAG: SDR family NAD(P)-dependent oxidoreductase, partial [Mycobacterium sp.]
AAGCQALGLPTEAAQVTGLEIEQTLTLDRRTQVTTQLTQADGATRVEIHARPADGTWCRYAVANVDAVHMDGPPAPGIPEPAGSSETDIVLPDEIVGHPCYRIHPALIDAALRHLAAAVPDESATAYLPVSVATVRVFGPVGRRARCRTELVGTEPEGDGGHLGRIVLSDDADTPTAELTGVELRQIDLATLRLPLEQKIFDTEWVESSATENDSGLPAGSWLLLADSDLETQTLVAEFATRLRSATRRVITAGLFDPASEALTEAGADPERPPVGIVVFVGKHPFDGVDLDGALARARELTWSAWITARAAVDGLPGKSTRLWLITRDGLAVRADEPGDPAIGALRGLIRNWRFPGEAARVLADEPDLRATLVDLGGMKGAEDVAAALLTELAAPASDDVIAWREQRRYAERLTRAALAPGDREAIVRTDGAYIITGGLGGLGTVVARWLVQRGAGRLVLNGRSEPSDAQRNVISELGESAEVAFVSGDIATPGVAERLVTAAEETGKPLRGVLHAAGVTGEGPVTALTREGLDRVWAPKVAGALRLHAATADRELDWWVGFSSMATLLGLPGQAAYTTANAWLDALMAWRHASGLPATAIDWGQWSDVGMSHRLTYSVLDPITPGEGTEALQSLVGGKLTRVGVGRLRLDRAAATAAEFRDVGYFDNVVSEFDTAIGAESGAAGSAADGQARSAAPVPDWSQLPGEERLGELVVRLQAILASALRMPASAVDVNQPFPELGLDSMMAMRVLKETQRLVNIDLSASIFWNHPTVAALATYLVELLTPQDLPQDDMEGNGADLIDSTGGVLDELFDSVESGSVGSESGI